MSICVNLSREVLLTIAKMLIDFTVANFRSIKGTVTLSTVAQSHANLRSDQGAAKRRKNVTPDNQIASTIPIEGRSLELLPVLGIFGANASGKSNVLLALDELLGFIYLGADSEGTNNFRNLSTPFRLSKDTLTDPTSYELRVVRERVIYTYSLEVDRTKVLKERLDYIPRISKRMQSRLLYSRIWNEAEKSYEIKNGSDFGNTYKEIQQSLRPHEPFMSILAQRIKVKVVVPFTDWLSALWPGVTLGWEDADHRLATTLATTWPAMKEQVTSLICMFDTGINDFEIVKSQPETQKKAKGDDDSFHVSVTHHTKDGEVVWLLDDESTGTQRLFSLAYKMLDAFRNGLLVLVDELGANIHPNITRTIVRMFQSKKINPHGAQLIFTSHDNTLQRGNLLRRDQIWFTQKMPDASTHLYPLTDFHPRNDLALDKAYLDGRFGAVPVLPEEENLYRLIE